MRMMICRIVKSLVLSWQCVLWAACGVCTALYDYDLHPVNTDSSWRQRWWFSSLKMDLSSSKKHIIQSVSTVQPDRAGVISLSLVMKMLNITTSTFCLQRKYLFWRLFHDPPASIKVFIKYLINCNDHLISPWGLQKKSFHQIPSNIQFTRSAENHIGLVCHNFSSWLSCF